MSCFICYDISIILFNNVHSSATLTFKLHSLFYFSPHCKRCKIDAIFFDSLFIFLVLNYTRAVLFILLYFSSTFWRKPCATLMRSYIIPFCTKRQWGGLSPSCMAIDTRRWDNFRREWCALRFKLKIW